MTEVPAKDEDQDGEPPDAAGILRAKLGASRPRGPQPRLYRYLDAIVRHGSIRRAAEELSIASSALNRRLLDFEADLGTPMFTRLRHGLRLTPAGEIVAAHLRATLDDAARVADLLHNLEGAVGGRVAIASAESAATSFLPPLLASVQAEFPALAFVLAVGSPQALLADLIAGRVDLVITHEEPRHADIAVLASASEPFCAVMRAGHPLAGREGLLMEDCLAWPIVIAHEDLAARAVFETVMQGATLPREPALVTNLFESMKRYVAMTDAVSFQFHIGDAQSAARDGLVAVRLADRQVAEARLWLATQRGRVLPPGARAMAERVAAVMKAGAD